MSEEQVVWLQKRLNDEMKKLREVNKRFGEQYRDLVDKINLLRKENERLREALREIAEYSGMVNTEQRPVLMARAALADQPTKVRVPSWEPAEEGDEVGQ